MCFFCHFCPPGLELLLLPNPPPKDMCPFNLRARRGEEKHGCQRDIYGLPPVRAPLGSTPQNPLVHWTEEPCAGLCPCRCGPSRAAAARAALLCCQGSGPASPCAAVPVSARAAGGELRARPSVSQDLRAGAGPPWARREVCCSGRPVRACDLHSAENSVPVAGQFTLGSGLRGRGPRPVCTPAGVPHRPEVLARGVAPALGLSQRAYFCGVGFLRGFTAKLSL